MTVEQKIKNLLSDALENGKITMDDLLFFLTLFSVCEGEEDYKLIVSVLQEKFPIFEDLTITENYTISQAKKHVMRRVLKKFPEFEKHINKKK